jgi:predicted RNA-binding Zn ribbon-like protein
MDERRNHIHPTAPQEIDETPPAPGELELVRSFLSLHDHAPGDPMSLPPTPESLAWWLHEYGLIDERDRPTADELAKAAEVQEALRSLVGTPEPGDEDRSGWAAPDLEVLNEAARKASLEPRFDLATLEPRRRGVTGALGKILALAFLAQLDGTWANLKDCGSSTCRSVFYDRSKNHSGKWCTMSSCGNRAKVRAFRARKAAAVESGAPKP